MPAAAVKAQLNPDVQQERAIEGWYSRGYRPWYSVETASIHVPRPVFPKTHWGVSSRGCALSALRSWRQQPYFELFVTSELTIS